MAVKSLAIKYRPQNFTDVVEQGATKIILEQQLETGDIKNAYLFCGGAGTGKTTCARIFAHEINKGQGNPIEMDAASNNSVEDVRLIIQQAKTKSLDSEYKVFIIDECHSLSNTAWQAMLKLIEEPPAKSIFIFATTDPQKIPKTILSRVQRYDFQRISYSGILERLRTILIKEDEEILNSGGLDGFYADTVEDEALSYIAKLADGGMRDSLTMLDKCIAYGELTLENVVKALGTANYDIMFDLTDYIYNHDVSKIIETIENIHQQGLDLKQFINQYMTFILDVCKYRYMRNMDYIQIPNNYEHELEILDNDQMNFCSELLSTLINLKADIKWDSTPKFMIEAVLIQERG